MAKQTKTGWLIPAAQLVRPVWSCGRPEHAEQLRHLSSAGDNVPESVRQHLEGAAVAIWTTTGWTIPANQAVAVNERLQYAVVEAQACPLLSCSWACASERKQLGRLRIQHVVSVLAQGMLLCLCCIVHQLAEREA